MCKARCFERRTTACHPNPHCCNKEAVVLGDVQKLSVTLVPGLAGHQFMRQAHTPEFLQEVEC